jgi:hypothetical protein
MVYPSGLCCSNEGLVNDFPYLFWLMQYHTNQVMHQMQDLNWPILSSVFYVVEGWKSFLSRNHKVFLNKQQFARCGKMFSTLTRELNDRFSIFPWKNQSWSFPLPEVVALNIFMFPLSLRCFTYSIFWWVQYCPIIQNTNLIYCAVQLVFVLYSGLCRIFYLS